MKKALIALIAIAIITTASLAQDKLTQARWHVAQALLSRDWPAEQQAFLLRAATSPTKEMEAEARNLFDREDFKDIFLKIGTRTTDKYKAVHDLTTLAEKKLLMRSLTQAERATVWRTHLAYVLATKELTAEQQGFLIAAARFIGSPTEELGADLGRRSQELFGAEGRDIFGTIGPFTSVGRLCREPLTKDGRAVTELRMAPVGDCVCNVNGSNWSCYDTCVSSDSCTAIDGCGFMWMFRCNGTCRTEPINN